MIHLKVELKNKANVNWTKSPPPVSKWHWSWFSAWVLIPGAAWQKNRQHLQHLCRCSTASPPNTLSASIVLATWWYTSGVQQTLPTMHTSLVCSCKPRAFNDTQAASRSSARAQCLSLKVLTDRSEREKHHGVGEKGSFFVVACWCWALQLVNTTVCFDSSAADFTVSDCGGERSFAFKHSQTNQQFYLLELLISANTCSSDKLLYSLCVQMCPCGLKKCIFF